MSVRKFTFPDFLMITVFGGLCLLAALYFLPNIEQGRNETRLDSAYRSVLTMRDIHPGQREQAELPEENNDPWGNPYRVETMADGHVRVVSSGPNGTSPDVGLDDDDIHSDMTVSPAKPIRDRRRRRILLASGGAFIGWVILSVLWLRYGSASAL